MQIIEHDRCCGCGACLNACPLGCIVMTASNEGFYYPYVDESKCVKCGKCKSVCPVLNPVPENGKSPDVYIAFNQDEEVRRNSSSGGAFSSFATLVLQAHGVVYGAAMRQDCYGAEQIRVDSMDGLNSLRGSKYIQSNVGLSFQNVKDDLLNGITVLYSGTPCQIEGLKHFLGRDYSNLYCVDFVCHGVPSEKLWKKYVLSLEDKYRSKVEKVAFRDKRTGWHDYSFVVQLSNGEEIAEKFEDNLYGGAFIRNADLRNCCYECDFKKKSRISDLTIADAWGIELYRPNLSDNKGLSLIYVNTEAGQKLFNDLQTLSVIQCTDEECSRLYSRLQDNVPKHKSRNRLYSEIDNCSIEELIKKYAKPTMKKRMVYVLRKMGLLYKLKKILKK